jgi:hypothetical protein
MIRRAAPLLALLLVVPILLALRYDGVAGSVLSVLHLRTTDSCLGGYSRSISMPNFCQKTSEVSTIWTDAVACTATDPIDTLPTTATHLALAITWRAYSNNAIAQRANEIRFFDNASCAVGMYGYSRLDLREFAAVVAGTIIGVVHDHAMVPLVNESGVMKFRTTELNAGGNGNADLHQIRIEGYYD